MISTMHPMSHNVFQQITWHKWHKFPTTPYSSQKYNLRFWLWDPKWNLQFATVKNHSKTNMENQKLDGLGRCFSSEQGLFFLGFVSRTSVPRWPSRTWQMWEASAHEKPEKENPKNQHLRGGCGHIFLGWKLKIDADLWNFEMKDL